MYILGISAYYHDSAAALLENGHIVAAAQEERFTRKKHDPDFPKRAIEYCLMERKLLLKDLDYVIFYDKPFLKFERLLETYLNFAPKGFESFFMAIPVWLREKLFLKNLLLNSLKSLGKAVFPSEKLLFSEHHLSHAASAYYPSPFNEAVVLTMDGVGEWATTSVAIGKGNHLNVIKEINFPHSLGLLYSAFTYYTGFKVNSGEYKLMGLAPYGNPSFTKTIIGTLIDIKEDGSFRLNQDYFNYCTGLTMTNKKFDQLFGQPRRTPEEELTQFHMDIAASIQEVTEIVILKLTKSLAENSNIPNLCLAGGVALNCVANGKILKQKQFEKIWIQPAAGDAGGALGAALCAYHIHKNQARIKLDSEDAMSGTYLGPQFNQKEIETRLNAVGAKFKVYSDDEVIEKTVGALVAEKAIGWFQGRMEFGPRALGARSIIGDPRSLSMQRVLNLKVKYRESFRPFAPSILREDVEEWFDLKSDSPYMLFVADVKSNKQRKMTETEEKLFGIDKLNIQRSEIPAITHVDYSARIQTVHQKTNPKYHKLIANFKKKTGCPIVINTSFNVRGEPIVCTPEDAFHCFMGTGIEVLVCGNCYLQKEKQDPSLKLDYKSEFKLD
jgi:carbamoyltransferase